MHLKIMLCVSVSGCHGMSFMFSWTFGDATVFQLFLLVKATLTYTPAININKTHWFIKLDFVGISTLVCHGLPT